MPPERIEPTSRSAHSIESDQQTRCAALASRIDLQGIRDCRTATPLRCTLDKAGDYVAEPERILLAVSNACSAARSPNAR